MKFFTTLVAGILVAQCCMAAPQRGGDPEDEIEFVQAENTNTRHPETGFPFFGSGGTRNNRVPIIIVRSSSGGRNPLHTLLKDLFGPSGSSGGNNEENENNGDDIPEIPISAFPDLSSVLGISTKDDNEGDVGTDNEFFPSFPSIFRRPTSNGNEKCGLVCTLLKGVDTQLKQIEEEVREIRDREREKENEISQGVDEENDGPVNEYTEEVLEDGTIVKTNKTYHTSEDGSSFFSFQSTSFNSFGHSTDKKTEEEDKKTEIVDKNEQDDTKVDNDKKVDGEENFSPKEYEDNNDEREELEENVGVDEGLFNA